MCTAEDAAVLLHAMPDHPASAMRTSRSERLYRAFETVEDVRLVFHDDLKGLVVRVATNLALCGRHADDSSLARLARPSNGRPIVGARADGLRPTPRAQVALPQMLGETCASSSRGRAGPTKAGAPYAAKSDAFTREQASARGDPFPTSPTARAPLSTARAPSARALVREGCPAGARRRKVRRATAGEGKRSLHLWLLDQRWAASTSSAFVCSGVSTRWGSSST
jgi:hypothetical protein